jgi:hypothetical protein
MEGYNVVKYSSLYSKEWNDFVKNSKNATFLFHRGFMEYHSDRFDDFSLLIFRKNKLIALLPANVDGQILYSHQGLTYGGLILPKQIKFKEVIGIFRELLHTLKNYGIESLVLKRIPSIYSEIFTEELEYLMFILKAELIKRDTISVLNLNNKLKVSKDRLEGYKRGKKYNLEIKEETNFELFWNQILVPNLRKKYNIAPVHSLNEIALLKKRFPKNIRQFNVYNKNEIVAGTTIFESKYVAHSQYISGNNSKNTIGSLDFLHVYLTEVVFKDKSFFDFGTSNENNGMNINEGLQYWKEGFGARTVVQNFYKIDVNNFNLLNKVLI